MNFETILTKAGELGVAYIPKVVGGIIILLVGLFVIKKIANIVRKSLVKGNVDATLTPFLVSITSTVLKILLVISVLTMFGADLTSFIAILTASSLAIGLAFQGALSNFAGGVLLLILRPFHVGDFISATGHTGTVEAIHVFNTVLVTLDNQVITIPNGALANTSITNVNAKPTRRVDLNFGVGYEQDIDKVKGILNEICATHQHVLKDPAPFIKLIEHGDSAVVFVVRAWTNTANYWDVYFDLLETVKKRFDEEGVSIPYPQMDIHMDK